MNFKKTKVIKLEPVISIYYHFKKHPVLSLAFGTVQHFRKCLRFIIPIWLLMITMRQPRLNIQLVIEMVTQQQEALIILSFSKIENQKTNVCDNITIDYATNAINSVTPISTNILSGSTPVTGNTMSFNPLNLALTVDSCDPNFSVNDPSKVNSIIYPNPSSSYVFINNQENIINVSIYDVGGKKVYETNSYDMDQGIYIGDLESGLYFMNFETDSFVSKSFKIIKK